MKVWLRCYVCDSGGGEVDVRGEDGVTGGNDSIDHTTHQLSTHTRSVLTSFRYVQFKVISERLDELIQRIFHPLILESFGVSGHM